MQNDPTSCRNSASEVKLKNKTGSYDEEHNAKQSTASASQRERHVYSIQPASLCLPSTIDPVHFACDSFIVRSPICLPRNCPVQTSATHGTRKGIKFIAK